MALRKFLFQEATQMYHEEQAATDELALGKLTLSGVAGIAIDAGTQRITAVATPTAASDATTKAYVDALANGVDWKASVRLATTANLVATRASNVLTADANGALTVDGTSPVVGNRILVKNQSTGADNGIYEVTAVGDGSNPYVLTRTEDANLSAEVTSGLAVFVEEGTVNNDQGYMLITADPITLNTTALSFTQFTGLGQVVAGAGLTKTGNQLDVGAGDGIDVAADSVAVALHATSGLEFSGGDLRVDADTARGLAIDATGLYIALATDPGLQFSAGLLDTLLVSTGGLQKAAGGLSIKIDDTPDTLDVDADGLKVVGLPSLFKVAGTAVGATVTASNLDTLTNGSNADALHSHSVAAVQKVSETWTAAGGIAKADGVYVSANDSVSKGDSTDVAKSTVLGVADAAAADTTSATVVRSGVITGALSGATAGVKYFMGGTGQPVLAGALATGARTIMLGIAKNATDLDVMIFDYGKKAS